MGFNKACLFFYNLDMGRKIAWAKIAQEYITGNVSYRDLAAKYNVSPSDITRHSKQEEWIKKRKAHRNKVRTKAEQKIAKKQSEELVRIAEIAAKTTGQIMQILDMEMHDPTLLFATGQHNREIESKVNALTKLYELQARHLGMMNPRDAEKLKLEREKFEWEKKRAEADANADKAVEIVLADEIEELSK